MIPKSFNWITIFNKVRELPDQVGSSGLVILILGVLLHGLLSNIRLQVHCIISTTFIKQSIIGQL